MVEGNKSESTQAIRFATWARPVAEFLSYNIPYDEVVGWLHLSKKEFMVGCEALIALGQARETEWGASPLRFPEYPSPLPRWDDICAVVIRVATKTRQLAFQPSDISSEAGLVNVDLSSMDAIAAANGIRAAFVTVNLYPVLIALGLVEGGHWSVVAKAVRQRADV